jgi:hypothetical protein
MFSVTPPVAGTVRRHVSFTLLALIGCGGLVALIASDLVLVWSPARNLDPARAAQGKSDARLVWGSLAGVVAIPFVLAGVVSLWPALAPGGAWLSYPPLLLAGFAYVIGAGFHAAVGLYALALRDAAAPATLKTMARIFDPLRTLLWVSIFLSSIWIFFSVVSGATLYPRWVAAVSPLPCVVLFRVLGRIGPPAIAGAAVPAGGNTAMLIFLLVSQAVIHPE